MIICLGYCIGEHSEYKYFESYEAMGKFIDKVRQVSGQEFEHFDVTYYTGKEEERIKSYDTFVLNSAPEEEKQ